ncbi:MAG: DUF2254 family protein [Actinomycetota bacterium]
MQQGSAQFSPRVIPGLTRDPFNRRVIAIVVGTFTYCLVAAACAGTAHRRWRAGHPQPCDLAWPSAGTWRGAGGRCGHTSHRSADGRQQDSRRDPRRGDPDPRHDQRADSYRADRTAIREGCRRSSGSMRVGSSPRSGGPCHPTTLTV